MVGRWNFLTKWSVFRGHVTFLGGSFIEIMLFICNFGDTSTTVWVFLTLGLFRNSWEFLVESPEMEIPGLFSRRWLVLYFTQSTPLSIGYIYNGYIGVVFKYFFSYPWRSMSVIVPYGAMLTQRRYMIHDSDFCIRLGISGSRRVSNG